MQDKLLIEAENKKVKSVADHFILMATWFTIIFGGLWIWFALINLFF